MLASPRASPRDAIAADDLVRRIEEASHKIQRVVDRTERAASKMLLASAVRKRRQHALRLQRQQQQHEGGGHRAAQSGANQQGGTPQTLASAAASPSGPPVPCAEDTLASSARLDSLTSPARTSSDASPSESMSPASARPSTRAQLQQLLQKSHRQLKGLIAAQRHDILNLAKALEEDKSLRTLSVKTSTTAHAASTLDAVAPQSNVTQTQGKADTVNHFKTPPRPRAKKSGASQSRRAKIISLLKRHRRLSLQLSAQTASDSARDAGVNQESITSDIADVVKQLNDLSVKIPEHLQTKANPQSSGKCRALESSPSKGSGLASSEPSAPSVKASLKNREMKPFCDATTTEDRMPFSLDESKTPSRTIPIERTNAMPPPQSNPPPKRFEYLFARIMAGPSPHRSPGAVCAANATLMTESTSTVPISTPEKTCNETSCPDGYTTPKRQCRRTRRGSKGSARVRSSAARQAPDTATQHGEKEQEDRLSPRNPTPGSRKRARASEDIGSAHGLVQPEHQPQGFAFSPSSNSHCDNDSGRKSLTGHFESLGLVDSPNLFAGQDGVSNMVSPGESQVLSSTPTPSFPPSSKTDLDQSPAAPRRLFVRTPPRVREGNRSASVSASDNSRPHQQTTVRESAQGLVPLPFPPMSPILEPVDRSAIFDEHEDLEDLHVVKTLDMFSASKQRRKARSDGIRGTRPSPALRHRHRRARNGLLGRTLQSPKLGNRVNLRNSLSLARK